MEQENTVAQKQTSQPERGPYKRPELVMKYSKSTESGDSVYDTLQLLCILTGFGSMMMGVSAYDKEQIESLGFTHSHLVFTFQQA